VYQKAIPRGGFGDHWTPRELASLLDGLNVRWCVVGGWALELAGVLPPRPHSDVEIAVPQFEFERLREWLPSYEFFVIGRHGMWPAESADGAFFDNPQTFIRDPRSGTWKADVIRSQYDCDTWVFQLDRSVRRPYDAAVGATSDAIPYLRPELVLLYKALSPKEKKNDGDFRASTGSLTRSEQRWLADTLAVIAGPDHPWLSRLRD